MWVTNEVLFLCIVYNFNLSDGGGGWTIRSWFFGARGKGAGVQVEPVDRASADIGVIHTPIHHTFLRAISRTLLAIASTRTAGLGQDRKYI